MSGWAQRAAERAEDEARDVSADEGIDWRGRALAAEALLGAAARGELPRCDDCRALATVHIPNAREWLCDACFDAPNQDCDLSGWPDLPHAAALRAVVAKGGPTCPECGGVGYVPASEVDALRAEVTRLTEALRFLCRADAGPCDFCGATATKRDHAERLVWWCDVCAPPDAVDHEHAATLRPLLPPRGKPQWGER